MRFTVSLLLILISVFIFLYPNEKLLLLLINKYRWIVCFSYYIPIWPYWPKNPLVTSSVRFCWCKYQVVTRTVPSHKPTASLELLPCDDTPFWSYSHAPSPILRRGKPFPVFIAIIFYPYKESAFFSASLNYRCNFICFSPTLENGSIFF